MTSTHRRQCRRRHAAGDTSRAITGQLGRSILYPLQSLSFCSQATRHLTVLGGMETAGWLELSPASCRRCQSASAAVEAPNLTDNQ